jgi:lipoprotein signal peptidase
MKKMTHEQIEELNGLLVDHSETLTSFFNEGVAFGKRHGIVTGISIGAAMACIGYVTGVVINNKKTLKMIKNTKIPHKEES